LTGGATHSVPPVNGAACRPLVPYRIRPALLLRTFVASTSKPEPALADGTPTPAIAGVQPSEFTFAVQ
jgi:hypothetical protein